MNVDLFLSSPAYQQWKLTHSNASYQEDWYIQDLVQSSSFLNWIQLNPNGTVDQYLQAIRTYQQTPEYQIQELKSEIHYLNEQIEELNDELANFQEEISAKDDEILSLTSANNILWTTSIILFFCIIVMLVLRIKSKYKKLNSNKNPSRRI